MAFARDKVSSQGVGNNTGFVSVVFSTLPVASAFIVFCVWNTSTDSPTVTDTSGNQYIPIKFFTVGDVSCTIFYTNYKLKLPGSGSLTVTATAHSGSHFYGAQAASYTNSSPGTVIPDYQAINTSGGTAAAFSFASGIPAQSGELYVSVMGQNSSGASEGVFLSAVNGQTGNYSLVGTPVNDGSLYEVGGMADFLSSDSVVRYIFWNWSGNDSVPFSSIIVPFLLQPFPIKTTTTIEQAVRRAGFR